MAIYKIKVTVRGTNRNHVGLIDLARRQLDYLGPRGMIMKRGKTDEACKKAKGLAACRVGHFAADNAKADLAYAA